MNKQLMPSVIEDLRPTAAPDRMRLTALWVLMWLVAALLLSRSFYLQVVKGSTFRSVAEHNRVDTLRVTAPRGIIYDRTGKQLVENISSTDLVFDPSLLPAEEHEASLIENLLPLLPGLKPEEIRGALSQARATQQEAVIAKALDHETVLKLEAAGEKIAGARITSSLVRKYPFGHSAAHVLGYTGTITREELEANDELSPTDTIGKQGLEKTYDAQLRGRHGAAYVEVDVAGRPQTDLGKTEPVPGQDIELTLNMELQEYIYAWFSEWDSKRREEGKPPTSGSVIVMDPKSGEILALASYPAFDPNAFSQPGLRQTASQYFTDAAQPLFNRAIAGAYPSGSTIKPFLAAAGLAEGIITSQTTVLSTGGISIGPWNFPDWKAGGHGSTDVKKAIAESVNTFFYLLAGGDDTRPGLGVNKAVEYLAGFNWGRKTGIDLPAEADGFLPTPEWKQRAKGESWYIGDTYHLGIGQGDVLATPLQVAAATAAVADGQYLYQPHFVSRDVNQHAIPIPPEHIRVVREGMRQTVTEGSGRALADLPITIAGKTGTAQIGGTEDTHAWFTSFGPYEDPEIVVTVMLERGGEGDKDAVPFAKEIWGWWVANRDKQK